MDETAKSDEIILKVEDLKTYFYTSYGVVKAVDGVSFYLRKGETIALVGESGCGKSTIALSLLRLEPKPAGRIVGGSIWLDGENLVEKSPNEMRKVRGKKISMILQDPTSSLNPVLSIGNQVGEAISIHQNLKGHALREKTLDMLNLVKIPAPEVRLNEFPHQMSGGMQQRIVGAISLSCDPMVLVADEPTTSLDVTIQAQYLKLLRDLQRELSLSLIFITHDFGIVSEMCDRVYVMYAGKIVEAAPIEELWDNSRHPYTQALIGSLPSHEERVERLVSIDGQPPVLHDLPPGCPFFPRCEVAGDARCDKEFPSMIQVGPEHEVSCWCWLHIPMHAGH